MESLADAQRAIRTVRSRAREWGVDTAHVGIMGFSAGGELAAYAETRWDRGKADAADAIERQSSRPDFAVLAYPGGKAANLTVTKETPATFIVVNNDDNLGACQRRLLRRHSQGRRAGGTAHLQSRRPRFRHDRAHPGLRTTPRLRLARTFSGVDGGYGLPDTLRGVSSHAHSGDDAGGAGGPVRRRAAGIRAVHARRHADGQYPRRGTGQPTPVRVRLRDEKGERPRVRGAVAVSESAIPVPRQAIAVLFGTDDRAEGYAIQPDGSFYVDGAFDVRLPPGTYTLTVSKGIEYLRETQTIELKAGTFGEARVQNAPMDGYARARLVFGGRSHTPAPFPCRRPCHRAMDRGGRHPRGQLAAHGRFLDDLLRAVRLRRARTVSGGGCKLTKQVRRLVITSPTEPLTPMKARVLDATQPLRSFEVRPTTTFHTHADNTCPTVRTGMTISLCSSLAWFGTKLPRLTNEDRAARL